MILVFRFDKYLLQKNYNTFIQFWTCSDKVKI